MSSGHAHVVIHGGAAAKLVLQHVPPAATNAAASAPPSRRLGLPDAITPREPATKRYRRQQPQPQSQSPSQSQSHSPSQLQCQQLPRCDVIAKCEKQLQQGGRPQSCTNSVINSNSKISIRTTKTKGSSGNSSGEETCVVDDTHSSAVPNPSQPVLIKVAATAAAAAAKRASNKQTPRGSPLSTTTTPTNTSSSTQQQQPANAVSPQCSLSTTRTPPLALAHVANVNSSSHNNTHNNGNDAAPLCIVPNSIEEPISAGILDVEYHPAGDGTKAISIQRWERRWVKCGHLTLFKWVPCERKRAPTQLSTQEGNNQPSNPDEDVFPWFNNNSFDGF
ncbi:hypothetical protein Pelo_10930 [Pelomyxa schiedti]|nr:hypothetical protein Pelo_10930 [Pelomyxa schiedti]